MSAFNIRLGESTVVITCHDSRALEFLSFLFSDVSDDNAHDAPSHTLSLHYQEDSGKYHLLDNGQTIHRGELNVSYAAKLYDIVIYHLLNKADRTIALHAGAVVHNDSVILLPGMSGAGKSSLTAWLVAKGCSYLSDELISASIDKPGHVCYFSRPICLKPGSVPLIKQLSETASSPPLLLDSSGAVLPHRLLNPEFTPISAPPAKILFPDFQADSEPHIEPISTARAATLLMGCLVNARNLENHGFKQILKMVGTTSAYRLRYRTFKEAETCLKDIIAW